MTTPDPEGPVHDLVLVGGGHAHLRVLASRVEEGWPPGRVLLVSEDRHHWYSGRVPGHLRGELPARALRFDLAALSRAAGVDFVEARVARIGRQGSRSLESGFELHLEGPGPGPGKGDDGPGDEEGDGPGPGYDEEGDDGKGDGPASTRPRPPRTPRSPRNPRTPEPPRPPLRARALSLDIGSVPRGLHLPGVREHALGVRPMARARELRSCLEARTRSRRPGQRVRILVVGGGAAGIEVALALHARVGALGREPEVVLLEAGDLLLPGWRTPARLRALRVLARRRVRVETGCRATEVTEAGVVCDQGLRRADLVVWLTGAAPPPLLAASELPRGEDGFLEVDRGLRASDGSPAWGAGDCIELAGGPPLPKAGVQAVRQGPILAANLRAHMEGAGGSRGGSPASFEPDPSFLALLDTSDGRALLRWRAISLHTRWARWLKDRIDGRFVEEYQALESSRD